MCYLLKKSHFCMIEHHVSKLFKPRSCFKSVESISSLQVNFQAASLNFNVCENIGCILKNRVEERTVNYNRIPTCEES